MNKTQYVFKKLFNSLDVGDKVRIKGIEKKGEIVSISCLGTFTIAYIDTGDYLLCRVYDLKRLELLNE